MPKLQSHSPACSRGPGWAAWWLSTGSKLGLTLALTRGGPWLLGRLLISLPVAQAPHLWRRDCFTEL